VLINCEQRVHAEVYNLRPQYEVYKNGSVVPNNGSQNFLAFAEYFRKGNITSVVEADLMVVQRERVAFQLKCGTKPSLGTPPYVGNCRRFLYSQTALDEVRDLLRSACNKSSPANSSGGCISLQLCVQALLGGRQSQATYIVSSMVLSEVAG